MRTPFENLKNGSKFKLRSDGSADYTKIDDSSYSFRDGSPVPIGHIHFVYSIHPDTLRNPELKEIPKETKQNPTSKTTPNTRIDGRLIIFIVIGIFLIIAAWFHNGSSNNTEINSQQLPSADFSEPTAQTPVVSNTANEQLNVTPKPSPVILARNSNGYDWKRADYQTRQQFCQTVAEAESKEFNHEFTADFYYDALDSFYSSSDPNVLNENINRVVGMTTAVAIEGQ